MELKSVTLLPSDASILTCGSKLTSMLVTLLLNPLNTDNTIINAATPIVTPIIDIKEIIVIKLKFFFENKYRFAMKNSSPKYDLNDLIKF